MVRNVTIRLQKLEHRLKIQVFWDVLLLSRHTKFLTSDRSAVRLSSGSSSPRRAETIRRLHDQKDEGTKILLNVENYLPNTV